MTESITITPTMETPSRHLLTASALSRCTSVSGPVVTRLWPNLSSGEELLWAVLTSINGKGDLPADDELRARLDTLNYAAADYATSYRPSSIELTEAP